MVSGDHLRDSVQNLQTLLLVLGETEQFKKLDLTISKYVVKVDQGWILVKILWRFLSEPKPDCFLIVSM